VPFRLFAEKARPTLYAIQGEVIFPMSTRFFTETEVSERTHISLGTLRR
jgi:hypothetical protein